MEIVDKLLKNSATYVFVDSHRPIADTCWICDQQYRHILIYNKNRNVPFTKRFIDIYIYDEPNNQDICNHVCVQLKHDMSDDNLKIIEEKRPDLYQRLVEYRAEQRWIEEQTNDDQTSEKNKDFWV